MPKPSRKLFQKRLTSEPSVRGIKQVDGRDAQIADVRDGNLNDNAIARRVISQGAVGFDEVGIREIGGNRIYVDGVAREHISASAVGNSEIANTAVTPGKLDRDYLTPSEGDGRYADKSHSHSFPSKTGTSDGSVGDHSHSISSTTFIKQPFEVRMRMLNDRLDLEEVLKMWHLPRPVKVIVRNILNILILLMDYRELNAYQRERAFVTEGLEAWTDTYKRVYGVDEYAEEDRENYLSYTLASDSSAGEHHTHVRMDPYTGIAPAEAGAEAHSVEDPGT